MQNNIGTKAACKVVLMELTTGVNFINVLWAAFAYERKHFRTKNACVKHSWNWRQDWWPSLFAYFVFWLFVDDHLIPKFAIHGSFPCLFEFFENFKYSVLQFWYLRVFVGHNRRQSLPDQTFILLLNSIGPVLDIFNTTWSVKFGKKLGCEIMFLIRIIYSLKLMFKYFFTPLWQKVWAVMSWLTQAPSKLYWSSEIILI